MNNTSISAAPSHTTVNSGFVFECLLPPDIRHRQTHPLYWDDLKRAHRLVAEIRRLQRIAKNAPQYIGGHYDPDYGGFEPVENIGPYDDAYVFLQKCLENPSVRRILEAHGRLDTIEHEFWL